MTQWKGCVAQSTNEALVRARSCFTVLAYLVLFAAADIAFAQGAPIEPNAGMATGGWSDEVAIEIPPAPLGTVPTVSLVAAHGVRDGEIGSGWRLNATSVLTRHSLTSGVPGHTDESQYRIDGQKLVEVTEPGGDHHQAETYDGARYDYHAASNTWTKRLNGWTWTYGSTAQTGQLATKSLYGPSGRSQYDLNIDGFLLRVLSFTTPTGTACLNENIECNTVAWYLSRAEDPHGNWINYDYTVASVPTGYPEAYFYESTRDHLLDTITYADGNASVQFHYADRPEPQLSVGSGTPTLVTQRLVEIEAKGRNEAAYSRTVIQYQDQTSHPRLMSVTDCDGDDVMASAITTQSLIRKIVRKGAGATGIERTLRCVKSAHQEETWQLNSEATDLSQVIKYSTLGGSTYDFDTEWTIPITLKLNRDGADDLIVLEFKRSPSYGVSHHVYIATPKADGSTFATSNNVVPSLGPREARAVATAWEDEIQAILNATYFNGGQGYAFTDLDGDSRAELVYEDAGVVRRLEMDANGSFQTTQLLLDPCDLRHATFADIDGDSHPDAVIRAHGIVGACGAQTTTRWIRNTGSVRYLDSSLAKDLAHPLEAATPPQEFVDTRDVICGGTITRPTPYNASWSHDNHYFGSNTQFTDVNGDGLSDLAVAAYLCWDEVGVEWERLADSAYSRIFIGDGFGEFIDSGLWAGAPQIMHMPAAVVGTEPRLLPGYFAALDINRSGRAELLRAYFGNSDPGIGITGAYWRGVLDGFGDANAADILGVDGTSDFFVGLGYASPGWSCHETSVTPAWGDFDGDGFVDQLTIEIHDTPPANSPCIADEWCVLLRRSERTTAEGRTTSSTNSWGGGTKLEWGFSALHSNPELVANLEVLEAVDGSEGHVEFHYSGAAVFDDGTPTPFGLVERTNHRGAVEAFAFGTTKPVAGKLLHAVRHRRDGSIEKVTANAYGERFAAGYAVSFNVPYYAPLIRQCDVDVGFGDADGFQSVDADSLIDACWNWGYSPFSQRRGELVVGQGHDPVGPEEQAVYAAIWSGAASGTMPLFGGAPGAATWPISDIPIASFGYPVYHWAIPAHLSPFMPNVDGAELGYVNPVALGDTTYRLYVQDWVYDDVTHQLDQHHDHLWAATTDDDLIVDYVWDQVDPDGDWYRLVSRLTTNFNGDQKREVTRADFAGFDRARSVEVCGETSTQCDADEYAFNDETGELIRHRYPDGTEESWVRSWCGLEEQHIDAGGRATVIVVDDRCLSLEVNANGGRVSTSYDAFNRPELTTLIPGGTSPPGIIEYSRDDSLQVGSDQDFVEPRVAELRNGDHLVLKYLDGFGRITRRTECANEGGGGGGVFALGSCVPGTERFVEENVWGADGLLRASVAPYRTGEQLVTEGYARDGAGRIVVRDEPAHVEVGPVWNQARAEFHVGRTLVQDAIGRRKATLTSTLEQSLEIDGVFRGREVNDELGLLVFAEASDGARTDYEYDGRHRLRRTSRSTSVPCVGPAGASQTCTWERTANTLDARGRVLQATGPDGVILDFTYDSLGRPLSRAVSSTGIETFMYRDGGALVLPQVTRTDEAGVSTVTDYDGFGRPVSRSLLDIVQTFAWRQDGQLLTAEENGRVTNYEYDELGQLIAVTKPGAGRTEMEHDGAGRVVAMTDADGVLEEYEYLYSGLLQSAMRGQWVMMERKFDKVGRATSVTYAGITTELDYDSLDRREEVRAGMRNGLPTSTYNFDYDLRDRVLISTVSPVASGSLTKSYTYNDYGWLTESEALGAIESLEYDAAGRVRRHIDQEGFTSRYTYDERGRQISSLRAGRGWQYASFTANATYNGDGWSAGNLRRVDTWDAQDEADGGAVTSTFLDGHGRVVAVENRDGSFLENTWDGREARESRWYSTSGVLERALGRSFDAGGRLETVEGPYYPSDVIDERSQRIFAYTAAGRVDSLTVPRSVVADADDITGFGYDRGLLSSESYLGLTRTIDRNLSHDPTITGETLASDATGKLRTTELERDGLGRIVERRVLDNGRVQRAVRSGLDAYGNASKTWTITDGVRQVMHDWVRDDFGLPTQRTTTMPGAAARTTRWNWYDNGVLEKTETPSGERIAYDYGTPSTGKLQRVFDPASGTDYAVFTARNERGDPTIVDLPLVGEARSYRYDLMGRLVSKESGPVVGPPTLVRDVDARDEAGRLLGETVTDIVAGTSWSHIFGYDGAGRLVSEENGKSGQIVSYAMDRAGNRLDTTLAIGGTVTTTRFGYDGALLDSVDGVTVYRDNWNGVVQDQRGNSYTRLPSGHVGSVTSTAGAVTFKRDVDGLAFGALEASGVRLTNWGLNTAGAPLEVTAASGDITTYIRAGGVNIGKLENGLFVTGEDDARGNLARDGSEVLGDATSFGESLVAPATSDERFLFAGLETMPAEIDGVQAARNRFYDPQTGQFLRPDPIGLRGGDNRLLYANGDPVQFRDPLGFTSCAAAGSGMLRPQALDTMTGYELDAGLSEPMASELASELAARFNRFSGIPDIFENLDAGGRNGNGPILCGFDCDESGGGGMGPVGQTDLLGVMGAKLTKNERREKRRKARDRRRRKEIALDGNNSHFEYCVEVGECKEPRKRRKGGFRFIRLGGTSEVEHTLQLAKPPKLGGSVGGDPEVDDPTPPMPRVREPTGETPSGPTGSVAPPVDPTLTVSEDDEPNLGESPSADYIGDEPDDGESPSADYIGGEPSVGENAWESGTSVFCMVVGAQLGVCGFDAEDAITQAIEDNPELGDPTLDPTEAADLFGHGTDSLTPDWFEKLGPIKDVDHIVREGQEYPNGYKDWYWMNPETGQWQRMVGRSDGKAIPEHPTYKVPARGGFPVGDDFDVGSLRPIK